MPIGPVAVEYEWTTEIHLISAAARNVSDSMRSGRQDARTNGLAGGLWENQFPLENKACACSRCVRNESVDS